MRSFRSIAVAAVLALALPVAAEDLTLTSKVTDQRGTRTKTSYMTSDKMRMSGQGPGDQDLVIDSAAQKMIFINTAKKEYSETTFAEMAQMQQQMAARMNAMREQMKGNPQGAAMMDKMMGPGGMFEVKVTKGTGGRTVAGYACENYTMTMGGMMTQELCTSTALKPPAAFFDMMKHAMGGGPMGDRMAPMFEELKKLNGVPLASTMTVSMMGRDMKTTEEVTEVSKAPIPASTFAVPEGYTKVASPMAEMTKKQR